MAGKVAENILTEADFKNIQHGLSLLEEITKDIAQSPDIDSMDRSTTVPILGREQIMEGPALRALHTYLKTVDPNRIWGRLNRTVTPDGQILWLCEQHHREYESKPLQI
jgi:hypothetical protein